MKSNTLSLSIGGLVFRISGPDEYLEYLDQGRYTDFRCSGDPPDFTLRLHEEVHPLSGLLPAGSRKLFDSGTVWSLWKSDQHLHILLRSPVHGGTPYRLASFDGRMTGGDVWTLAENGGEALLEDGRDPLEFPLSEVLMVILLSLGRGMMVHACGIKAGERGLLFPGNSTHGKSTMASLWKDRARILNDDRIILREVEGSIRMYGTPWHGDMTDVSAEGAALSSVNFLFHGSDNVLSRVRGAKAISMLLRRSFVPLWDREGMEFCLRFCETVEDTVPFRELHFVPDPSVVDFLECST